MSSGSPESCCCCCSSVSCGPLRAVAGVLLPITLLDAGVIIPLPIPELVDDLSMLARENIGLGPSPSSLKPLLSTGARGVPRSLSGLNRLSVCCATTARRGVMPLTRELAIWMLFGVLAGV